MSVRPLYTMVAMVHIAPGAEKTTEENDPCSISLIRSSYTLSFSLAHSFDNTGLGWSSDSKVRIGQEP